MLIRFFTVPFWELTSKVEDLSFSREDDRAFEYFPWHPEAGPEEEEHAITSFNIRDLIQAGHPRGKQTYFTVANGCNDKLHLLIVSRTILAAARGGRLRHLRLPRQPLRQLFAIRTLIPLWMQVEHWELYTNYYTPEDMWEEAASSLRPLLAHCSLWPTATSSAQAAAARRLLTAAQVQSFKQQLLQPYNGEYDRWVSLLEQLRPPRLNWHGYPMQWYQDNAVGRYLQCCFGRASCRCMERYRQAWRGGSRQVLL